MTARQIFRQFMAQRREWPRGSVDHDMWTRSARKMLWMHRGKPVSEWKE